MKGKTSGKLRRRLVIALGTGAGLVVLAFGISNLILAGRAESRLSSLSGLSWEIESARWSPWSGIRFRGLEGSVAPSAGEVTAPLCSIEEIRIVPYWRTLLEKRPQFKELEVVSPRGNLPIEVLAELAKTAGESDEPVQVGALRPPRDPAKPKVKKKPAAKKTEDRERPRDRKVAKKEKAPKKQKEKKPAPEQPAPAKADRPEEEALAARVVVRDGSLHLYSLEDPRLSLTVPWFACDLPVGGSKAEGRVEMNGLIVGGRPVVPPMRERVEWNGRELSWKRSIKDWRGLDLSLEAKVSPARRMQFGFAGQVQSSSLPGQEVPGFAGVHLGIGRIETAFVRAGGLLARPHTWQGDLVVDTRGVVVGQAGSGAVHRFDYGQLVAVARGGSLQVPDVRLRSERLSLLGNGLLLPDGSHHAVIRVVADDEYARAIQRIAIGSGLSGGWTSAWLQPLWTPDRRYRDIHITGRVPDLVADVGRHREKMPVGQALAVLRRFFDREVGENQVRR